ncbi:MAG: hypothetical protein CMH11_05775 [Maritimibacter sp.]|nr:hypothetical protein [Maritimibacter sp.]|tara:strand:+ start:33168 stop:33938 length:771 start_codon:yes stop_codon:yes gene_type:complete
MMTALLGLAAWPAAALDTRFGPVEIAPVGEMEKGLLFQGEVLELPSGPYVAFIEAALHDWVLIAVSQGGNACATEYVWAKLSDSGVDFSEVFGTCAEGFELTEVPAGAKVTSPSVEVGQGPVSFIYDGERITEVQEPAQQVGWSIGDPGTFWLDSYVFDFFGAAELQDPLMEMMTPEALATAQENAELGGPFAFEGDWIVGSACEKLECETDRVAVAVSEDGARVVIVLSEAGQAPQLFGDTDGPLPASLRDLAPQ